MTHGRPTRSISRRWRPGFGHPFTWLISLIGWLSLFVSVFLPAARRIDWSDGAWWKGPLLLAGSAVGAAVLGIGLALLFAGAGFVLDAIDRRGRRGE